MRAEWRVQAFLPMAKTLKWAGFACPFEWNAGSPQNREILWGGMKIVKTILVKNRLVNLIVRPQ